MVKICISGANGFVGRNLIKKATEQGIDTIGFVRTEEAASIVESLGGKPIITPEYKLNEILPHVEGSDAVFHLIGTIGHPLKEMEFVHVDLLKRVNNAVQQAKVTRIIHLSALGVTQYGVQPWATNDYFFTKKNAEQYLIKSCDNYVIFRPTFLFSPHVGLFPKIMKGMVSGEVEIVGPGDIPFQPIFYKDVVDILLKCVKKDAPFAKQYDLVGADRINLNTLVQFIEAEYSAQTDKDLEYSIKHIPFAAATEKLGLHADKVDIYECDYVGFNRRMVKDLNLDLTSLSDAITFCVKEYLKLK